MHNTRCTVYPDGTCRVLVAQRAIFREPGWESETPIKPPPAAAGFPLDAETAYAVLERAALEDDGPAPVVGDDRARRRARSAVRDLALSNTLDTFITLTLDPAKIDRYDPRAAARYLSRWADNRVRRSGLQYVIVPELHKDGAVHFHGLVNGAALRLVDSGTVKVPGIKSPRKPRSEAQRASWLADGGQVVYNVPEWAMGYSTALKLNGDYSAAVGYVCKYISKTADKVGGRWYYHGGALASPSVVYADSDWDDASGGYEFVVDGLGCAVRILNREGVRTDGQTENHDGEV